MDRVISTHVLALLGKSLFALRGLVASKQLMLTYIARGNAKVPSDEDETITIHMLSSSQFPRYESITSRN